MGQESHNLFQLVAEVLIGVIVLGISWYLKRLGGRVDEIEADLRKAQAESGSGTQKLTNLTTMIEAHVIREEKSLHDLEALYRDLLVKLTSLIGKLDAVAESARGATTHIEAHERDVVSSVA